jgi:cobalamin biosynthesis protein CbiG
LDELEQLLSDTFRANNLSLDSLDCVATATLKQDEPGLLALAEKYGASFRCYGPEELNGVFEGVFDGEPPVAGEGQPAEDCRSTGLVETPNAAGQPLHPSANARRLVGVWGVAEPSALLASGAGRLLVSKQTAARATVAVARREYAPG